ncbi:MAG: alpha/beta fold hydrolase [Acidimicrobiia bacterium]
MAQPFSSSLSVPVDGGSLHVGVAGAPPGTPGVPVVLAVHGITGSHVTWAPTARHLGGAVTFLAPDLRGRGQSAGLGVPYGMAAHADDLVAILDHVGCDRAVVAGHSMGGYVTTRFAATAPDRLAAAVLVDGGVPLSLPTDVDPDDLLAAVLGPALARLQMTFPSVDAYRDFWRAHPAFAPGPWTDDITDFVDYDLAPPSTGPEGEPIYRSRVSEAAVRGDGRDVLDSGALHKAFESLTQPCVLLCAPRGLLNEDRAFITPEARVEAQAVRPQLTVTEVDDTNHYFILLGPRPAGVVAGEIRRFATLASS